MFTDFGGYDDAFNAKFDKGKMEQVPVEDMRVYAGGDTDACYQVADLMQRELDSRTSRAPSSTSVAQEAST